MAPSSGLFLAPMMVRAARQALKKTINFIRTQAARGPTTATVEPAFARNVRQPLHPAALLRQSKGRWYTTHAHIRAAGSRSFSTAQGGRVFRGAMPKSRIGDMLSRLTSRTPFASVLRPNLTGGALPRAATGYTLGGGSRLGARFFSHGPAAPAEVINNVSIGMRAFFMSGKNVQYDGMDKKTGAKRFKAVTPLTKQMMSKIQSIPKITPGSFISFELSPTVTALSPFVASSQPVTLDTENVLTNLSYDFSRNLRDMYGVLADLSRLQTLGSLPVSFIAPSTIRVHFPGCDAETVERLCIDLGVKRGVIVQDESFDSQPAVEMALAFPFAPSRQLSPHTSPGNNYYFTHQQQQYQPTAIDWQDMLTPSPESGFTMEEIEYTPGQEFGCSSPEINQFSSIGSSSISEAGMFFQPLDEIAPIRPPTHRNEISESEEFQERNLAEFEGVDGIYRFLEECEGMGRLR